MRTIDSQFVMARTFYPQELETFRGMRTRVGCLGMK
jgi:hypothetical protein